MHEDEFVFVGELAGEQADPPQAGSFGGAPGHSGVSAVRGTDDAMYVAAVKKNQLMLYRIDETGGTTSAVIADFAANPSLAVDADGAFHLAYFETVQFHLMYATNQSGQWESETVDDTLVPSHFRGRPSLALGPDGEAYISYVKDMPEENYEEKLLMANNVSGQWQLEEIEVVGNYCTQSNSTFVDASGDVHLSYCRVIQPVNASIELLYASKDADGWSATSIQTDSSLAFYTKLQVADEGEITVAFSTVHGVEVARNIEGTWQIEEPFQNFDKSLVTQPSLVIDPTGALHLGVVAQGNSPDFLEVVGYATDASGSWAVEEIAPESVAYSWPVILAEESEAPSLVYFQVNEGRLWLAAKEDSQWSASIVDNAMNVSSAIDYELGPNGRAHLLFQNQANMNLFYAVSKKDGWAAKQVAANAGFFDMTLDAQGKVHMLYQDAETNAVFYLTNVSGKLTRKMLLEDYTGGTLALAVDAGGRAFVFYTLEGTVWYSCLTGETVLYEEAIQSFFSTALLMADIDDQGTIHLIQDGMMTNLHYLSKTVEGDWVVEEPFAGKVDSVFCAQCRFQVDGNGKVHLLMENRYKTNVTGEWTIEEINAPALGTKSYDLQVADDGTPLILINSWTPPMTSLWVKENGTWNETTYTLGTLIDGDVRFAIDDQSHLNLVYIGDDAIWYRIF